MSDTDTSAQHDWAALRRLAEAARDIWQVDPDTLDEPMWDLLATADRFDRAAHPAAVLALLDQRAVMLAALKLAEAAMGNIDPAKVVRAAIAKAEGRTP